MIEQNENQNNMPTMDDLPQAPEEYTADEPQQEEEQVQEAPQQESNKEMNLRRLRESKEKAERERDELLQYLRKQQAQQAPTPVDDEPQLGPDDLVEWKYVDKKIKSLEKKLQEQYESQRVASDEARIKSTYQDFDQVVNQDNIALFKELDPEGAQILANANVDTYTKASRLYKEIKRLGIIPEDTYVQERERVQKNAAKPRPLTSMNSQQGANPLARANAFADGLTEDLKKQLFKEMTQARKNR